MEQSSGAVNGQARESIATLMERMNGVIAVCKERHGNLDQQHAQVVELLAMQSKQIGELAENVTRLSERMASRSRAAQVWAIVMAAAVSAAGLVVSTFIKGGK